MVKGLRRKTLVRQSFSYQLVPEMHLLPIEPQPNLWRENL